MQTFGITVPRMFVLASYCFPTAKVHIKNEMRKSYALKNVKGSSRIATPHVKQPKPNNYESKNKMKFVPLADSNSVFTLPCR